MIVFNTCATNQPMTAATNTGFLIRPSKNVILLYALHIFFNRIMPVREHKVRCQPEHVIIQNRVSGSCRRRTVFFRRNRFNRRLFSGQTEDLFRELRPAAIAFTGAVEKPVIFRRQKKCDRFRQLVRACRRTDLISYDADFIMCFR